MWRIYPREVCEFCILLYYARKSVITFRNVILTKRCFSKNVLISFTFFLSFSSEVMFLFLSDICQFLGYHVKTLWKVFSAQAVWKDSSVQEVRSESFVCALNLLASKQCVADIYLMKRWTLETKTGLIKDHLRPRLHGTGFAWSRHRVRVVCGHVYSHHFFL